MGRPYDAQNDPIRLGLESAGNSLRQALQMRAQNKNAEIDQELRRRQMEMQAAAESRAQQDFEDKRRPIDISPALMSVSPEAEREALTKFMQQDYQSKMGPGFVGPVPESGIVKQINPRDYAILKEGSDRIRKDKADAIAAARLANQDKLIESQVVKNYADANKKETEASAGPKTTEGEKLSANYVQRMEKSGADLDRLFKSGYDPSSVEASAGRNVPRALEVFRPENAKLLENAEKNYLAAILRKESGAAISQNEYDEAGRIYFPRVGDGPDVLAQKKSNRDQAAAGLRAAAGAALKKVPLVKTESPSEQSRPAGKSDFQIMGEARAAIRRGAPKEAVLKQMQAWGIEGLDKF